MGCAGCWVVCCLVLARAVVLATSSRRACGVRDLSAEEALLVERQQQERFTTATSSVSSSSDSVSIEVYFHIITSSSGEGEVSDDAIDDQMTVMNDAFSSYFSFVKKGVKVVQSDTWFNMRMDESLSEGAAKANLRQVSQCKTLVSTAQGWSSLICSASYVFAAGKWRNIEHIHS